MKEIKDFEIVSHSSLSFLEIFFVEMHSRGAHGHSDIEMGIVLKGEVTLFIDNEVYELKQGDIYYTNRYQIHALSTRTDFSMILVMQVSRKFYKNMDPTLEFLFMQENVIRNQAARMRLADKFFELADTYFGESELYALHSARLLIEITEMMADNVPHTVKSEQESQSARANSRRINRMTEYIEEHYAEKLTLDDIAALDHISPYHASHFFKEMAGMSFQDYLNQVRFEHAIQLIHSSDLKLIDICMETGFSSTRYLNQMFEKNYGCSAKDFIRDRKKYHRKPTALPTGDNQKRYSYNASRTILASIHH